ncbi:hypothetical protein H5410_033056 [Solanum commersonii]|uniref:Uncharacterized protein n=1 Tax=Solanum commersonii TaxID=4109 RepID=A0A9J5YRZ2_SOLCO|nr:hypothetical protein H5410_033056 [Solanum commersonii]
MIASYSLKDLMSSRALNQVTNEPSVYQKVILLSIPSFIWLSSIVQRCTSFMEMCRASGNIEGCQNLMCWEKDQFVALFLNSITPTFVVNYVIVI